MFEIIKTKGNARRGKITTQHGVIKTPFFMPIATKGAVKTMSSKDMNTIGAQILLSNTYHLLLRPGLEGMKKLGGLHKLMNWDKPILTDSGGYQVFSLSKLSSRGACPSVRRGSAFSGNKTTEDGVVFQSHIDGSRLQMSPESSMEMQKAIGSDIAMQFDDVADGISTYDRFEDAMERSLRWAQRSKEAFQSSDVLTVSPGRRTVAVVPSDLFTATDLTHTLINTHDKIKHLPHTPSLVRREVTSGVAQLLFGIVQGGIYEDLRTRSANGLIEIGFDGYAIGGLSVGEPREDMFKMTKHTCDILPKDKIRYFMGGGMPEEIVENVKAGVDMFDCVLPSRNARHGTLFVWTQDPSTIDFFNVDPINPTWYQKLRITNEQCQFDESTVDQFCDCETCSTTSRAYLRHLFSVQEILAMRLATIHNLRFYLTLMEELRKRIES